MHFDEARISQFGVNVHIFTKSQCEGILVDGITPSYRFESSHHSTSYMFLVTILVHLAWVYWFVRIDIPF